MAPIDSARGLDVVDMVDLDCAAEESGIGSEQAHRACAIPCDDVSWLESGRGYRGPSRSEHIGASQIT